MFVTKFFRFIALLCFLFTTTEALALACYSSDVGGVFGGNGPGGVSHFYIDPSASVPESAPNNQIVWRGESQTVRVTCYKDANHHPGVRHLIEQVYFWPGKTGTPTVPDIPGIQIGFRYNGQDIYGTKRAVDGFVIDKCSHFESDNQCEQRTRVTKTITYQPIIITAPGVFTGYSGPVNIFQVDGELGYNGLFSNYNIVIENMDVLKPSKCEVELELESNDIDFGILSNTDVLETVSVPLKVVARNIKYGSDCSVVKLRGYFNNIREPTNNSYIPLFDFSGNKMNGIGVKLFSDGNEVTLNEPTKPYELTEVGYDSYSAVLFPLDPNNIDKGVFEGVVVYSVSYL